MTLRTIQVVTVDGQRAVFEYNTELQGADDEALMAEVVNALETRPYYVLTTRPDGTTATFLSELTDVRYVR